MAGKPAQPHKAHILIIEDDKGRREILLKSSRYSLGRTQKNDIIIHSPFVSRNHATLIRHFDEDGYVYYQVMDGDGAEKLSANGILINGRKVISHSLRHGDKIIFGPQVFALYQHCQRDLFPTMTPDDPFDITLIYPAMMIDDLED
jgi:pSer/pThr/pTyr-binding forkhead associated (FHA) protein